MNGTFEAGLGSRGAVSRFDSEVGAILGSHSEHEQRFVFFEAAMIHFTDAGMPDLLDASAIALTRLHEMPPPPAKPWDLPTPAPQPVSAILDSANDVLLQSRIDFVFLNGRLRPREAAPLHLTLTEPVEAVLTADLRFVDATAAYLQASAELATGHYGASITSAGSMLQASLVALGAKGNDLGALFADSIRRGFLMGHDEKLHMAFRNIGAWVTADRTNRGNAHGPAKAAREDAELALHIATAMVLRLSRLSEPSTTSD